LTICTIAIYVLLNIDQLGKNIFRYLVLGLFFSCLLDLINFAIKANDSNAPDVGTEKTLRGFAEIMGYIGFVVRILMAMIYWKDSLDYERVMLGKRVDRALIKTFSV
jgi:hypothetical protein